MLTIKNKITNADHVYFSLQTEDVLVAHFCSTQELNQIHLVSSSLVRTENNLGRMELFLRTGLHIKEVL